MYNQWNETTPRFFERTNKEQLDSYLGTLSKEERTIAVGVIADYLRQGKSLRYINCAFRKLKGRSIEKYRYLMFNDSFQEEVWDIFLHSLAFEIEPLLFNKDVSADEMQVLQNLFDLEEYDINERRILNENWGDDTGYQNGVVEYVYSKMKDMNYNDIRELDSIAEHAYEAEDSYDDNYMDY